MLHWLAASRAQHLPPAIRAAPSWSTSAAAAGSWRRTSPASATGTSGVDIGLPGLALAREHGVLPVRRLGARRPAGRRLRRRRRGLRDPRARRGRRRGAGRVRPAAAARAGLLLLDALAATRLSVLITVRLARAAAGRTAARPARPGAVRRPRAAARRRRPARARPAAGGPAPVGARGDRLEARPPRPGRRMMPLRCTASVFAGIRPQAVRRQRGRTDVPSGA